MPGLRSVKVIALRISAFLLARETGPEAARGIGATGCAVALAVGPVLLIIASVRLRLLLLKLVHMLPERGEVGVRWIGIRE
jgi:uncharacterized membrane protein